MPTKNAAAYAGGVDLARVFAKRWPLIVLTTLGSIGLAVLYYTQAPPEFESSVGILVMKRNADATSVSGQSGEIQTEVVEDVLATHLEILGSAQVLSDAIAERSLDQLPGVMDQLSEDVSAVEYLKDRLEITRGGEGQARDAQVISATFVHGDADEAETILGAIVESYENFLARTFEKSSSEALELLTKAKDDIAAELDAEERAYVKFRGEAPLVFAGDEAFSIHEKRLLELATQKSQLEIERSMVQSRLDLVKRSADEGLDDAQRLALVDRSHVERIGLMVSVVAGDTISEAFQAAQPERTEAASAEFDQLVSLRTERSLLQAKFGESHPRVNQLDSSIEELEGFLEQRKPSTVSPDDKLAPNEVMDAYVRLLETDIEDLNRRIEEIDGLMADSTDGAKSLSAVEAQGEMLSARLARKQELYDAVLSKLRDVNTLSLGKDISTEIISPVSEPEQVWPKLAILGLVGTMLGLGGGTAMAVAAEVSEQTFASPAEVTGALGLNSLGVIPRIGKPVDAATEQEAGVGRMLMAYHRPQSREAEAVRSIRTSIFFSENASDLRVLQITSPTPSDGKSLTAASLALSLAGAGKSVLLIDADLRKPNLQTNFPGAAARACGDEQRDRGVPRGLADLLVDAGDLPDLVVESGVPNLSLLFAGTTPGNPAELLSMDRADQLLETVRGQYDLVIVDTPPILAVSDPLNVAPKADGVVVVVPIKKNQAAAASQAVELLRGVKSNPVGVVVNDVAGRLAAARGRRYGYGDYGRYGSGHAYGYIDDHAGYTSERPATATTGV